MIPQGMATRTFDQACLFLLLLHRGGCLALNYRYNATVSFWGGRFAQSWRMIAAAVSRHCRYVVTIRRSTLKNTQVEH